MGGGASCPRRWDATTRGGGGGGHRARYNTTRDGPLPPVSRSLLALQPRPLVGVPKKERKKTDNPREGWEDGTPPPHTQMHATHSPLRIISPSKISSNHARSAAGGISQPSLRSLAMRSRTPTLVSITRLGSCSTSNPNPADGENRSEHERSSSCFFVRTARLRSPPGAPTASAADVARSRSWQAPGTCLAASDGESVDLSTVPSPRKTYQVGPPSSKAARRR